ncbi:hypothetical protein N9153_02060 [Planctomicrobium sp.]|jgi:hypothetical protein|nr:hypothetical protein [Planctomicrobium sp.]MDB4731673.1 hypothetical protein [bacterium]
MMGVIELVLIVVVIGVFSSVVLSSPSTRSRVDWSKVMLVFLGIPFLLVVALGGTYFLSQSRAQHEVAIAQVEKIIAQDVAASEMSSVLQEHESISDEGQTGLSHDDVTSTVTDSDNNYRGAQIPIYSAQHEMPSRIGMLTEAISQPKVISLVLIITFVIGLLIWLIAIRKNKVALLLTFASLGAAVLVFGLFSVKVDTIEYPAQPQITHSSALSPSQKPPAYQEDPNGSIPVDKEENEEDGTVKPLQILERDYDFSHGTSISSKSVNKIPNWVDEALTENVFRPDENEIVITSKRYSSLQEAEAELNKIAEMLVTDYIVGIYPEMRESWIDAEEIRRLGILEKSCEITWPFQVGEFKDTVYQVTWQLDVTSRIQNDLHDSWQRDSISQRLVYLGGGFGLITLIFGIGAVVTRGKKQETA